MTHKLILSGLPLAFLTSWLFMLGNSDLRISAAGGSTPDTIHAPTSLLKLTTRLVSQKFCVGDTEVSMLRIKLMLRYTNVGVRPIILDRGSNVAPTILVSRTAADATAGNRELIQSADIISAEEPGFAKTRRLLSSYVVLRKGSSFETNSEVSLGFAVNDEAAPPGTIKKGEHVLQIEVITWWDSPALAEELSAKWKHRGYLWHDVVRSEPMPFKIEEQVKLENCP